DALGGLRAQVVQAGLVLDRTEVGLEHHVEVTRLGPLAAGAAVRAGDLGEAALGGAALLLLELLLHLVGAVALVAGEALGERVGEHPDVAGGHPDLARQDDRGVEPDDVLPGLDHGAPPLALDVLLELDTQGPVVPRGPGPAVDLPRGEDETSPLREVDDGVQSGRRSGHVNHSSLWCVRTWRVRTGQTRAWLARAPHQPTWPTTDRETRPAPPAADAKLTTVLNSLENDSHDLAPRRAPLARRRAHPLRV